MGAGNNGGNAIIATAYQYYGWTVAQDGGRLQMRTSTNQSAAALLKLAYDYDNVGNILSITDQTDGANVEVSGYGYDALNRLTSLGVTVNGASTFSEGFAYDGAGRLQSASRNGGAAQPFGYDANHKHAVASFNGNSYGYDATGNQTSRMVGGVTYTLTYDGDNRLVQVDNPGGVLAKYWYDGDGTMVKGRMNTEDTYYPMEGYNKVVNAGAVTVKKYYSGVGQTLAVRTVSGGTDVLNWLLSDNIGSATVASDAAGNAVARQKYSAYGETRITSGALPTKYQYTGQLQQAEIGLYFYVSRFYDPATMHFVQADNIVPNAGDAPSHDRYAYVRNNPIRFNDPSGHYGADTGGYRYAERQTGIEL